jgi:hypothetical protein
MAQFFEYTENGIRFKGFQDLRKTLVEAWEATFGSEIDTSPTSPDGHHIDLETATINSVSELLQVVATTFNRNQATGEYLDLLAALLGLERSEGETDAELRDRMDSADRTGLATLDAMRTYLRNRIAPSIEVLENSEPTTDSNGIPGHHYRVVVPQTVYDELVEKAEEGEIANADDFIAQNIWNCKPAGIKGDGNMTGNAKDKSGYIHEMDFSMPTTVGIDVKVVLSIFDEGAFADAGGTDAVSASISEWATGTGAWSTAEFTPGQDVIPTRFYKPILAVPGVASAEISVRKSGTITWLNTTIEIGSQEIANLDSITVSKEEA